MKKRLTVVCAALALLVVMAQGAGAEEDYAKKLVRMVNSGLYLSIELEQDVTSPVTFNVPRFGAVVIDGKDKYYFRAGVKIVGAEGSIGRVVFYNTEIHGADGKDAPDCRDASELDGAPGLMVEGYARVKCQNCNLFGGDGGDGGRLATGQLVSGGNGGPGVLANEIEERQEWVDGHLETIPPTRKMLIDAAVGGKGGDYMLDDGSANRAGDGGPGVNIKNIGVTALIGAYGGPGGSASSGHRGGDGGCGIVDDSNMRCITHYNMTSGGDGGASATPGMDGRDGIGIEGSESGKKSYMYWMC